MSEPVAGKRVVIWLLGGVVLLAAVIALAIRLAAHDPKARDSARANNAEQQLTHPLDNWFDRLPPCPQGAALKQTTVPKQIWCETYEGAKHGAYTRWWSSGDMAEKGAYKQGKRSGMWTTWHENGRPASQAGYVEGKRVTALEEWTLEGKVKHLSE